MLLAQDICGSSTIIGKILPPNFNLCRKDENKENMVHKWPIKKIYLNRYKLKTEIFLFELAIAAFSTSLR